MDQQNNYWAYRYGQMQTNGYADTNKVSIKAPQSSNSIQELWERPNHFASLWAGYLVQMPGITEFIQTLQSITAYINEEIDLDNYVYVLLRDYILNQKANYEKHKHEAFMHVENKLTFEYAACNYINQLDHALQTIISEYKNVIGWSANGNVYFLLAEEPKLVKIGYQSTKNNPRSKSVHSHCPYDLKHLGSIMVGYGIQSEQTMHKDFKYWHYNREWFRYDDEVERRINFYIHRGYYDDCVKAMKHKEYNIAEYIRSQISKYPHCLTPQSFMMHQLYNLFCKYTSTPVKRQYLLAS